MYAIVCSCARFTSIGTSRFVRYILWLFLCLLHAAVAFPKGLKNSVLMYGLDLAISYGVHTKHVWLNTRLSDHSYIYNFEILDVSQVLFELQVIGTTNENGQILKAAKLVWNYFSLPEAIPRYEFLTHLQWVGSTWETYAGQKNLFTSLDICKVF